MKSIINFLLITSVTFGGKRKKSSTWAPGSSSGTPSPIPSNDELCGCYNIDLICAPIMNAGGEICYYYQIEKISDDDYCKPIEYISLGIGECGLTSNDIKSSLLDYAPKCYDIDPLYDGTCNNGEIGVPGIKIKMGPPPNEQYPDGSEPTDDYMVFSMCFDASKVSGFQESGKIGYKTKAGRSTCNAYTILPNFCNPTITESTTPSPVAPAPVTPAPITPASVTPNPTTPAPITPAPVTPAPVTPAPVTPAPITPTPTTPAPITPIPTTPAPVTPAPITPAPVTPSPTTPAPVTPAPVTPAPITPSPVTPAPVTPTPTTPAPVTPSPTTPTPTDAPTTPSPTTAAPSIAPTYVECTSNDELNIAFLLDESGSVDINEWDIITQFVERIVTFDVSPASYVSLYEYASLASYQELLSFTGPKSDAIAEQSIIDTLQTNVYNPSGQTETWDAVNRVLDDIHNYKTIDNCDGKTNDDCWQRNDILFLVTDGEPTGTPVCDDMSIRMAQSDVDIVVILIDPNGDIDETLVSCLDINNNGADVIRLPSFDSDAFNAIEARIRSKICSGNNPLSEGPQPAHNPWLYCDENGENCVEGLGPLPTRSGDGQGGAADPVKINNNQKDIDQLLNDNEQDINNNNTSWTLIIICVSSILFIVLLAIIIRYLLCGNKDNNKSVNDNDSEEIIDNNNNNEGNLSIMV